MAVAELLLGTTMLTFTARHSSQQEQAQNRTRKNCKQLELCTAPMICGFAGNN